MDTKLDAEAQIPSLRRHVSNPVHSSSNSFSTSNNSSFSQQSQHILSKRFKIKSKESINLNNDSSIVENVEPKKNIPLGYCININLDGSRDMDLVSHLESDQIENKSLIHKLRPISGIRNHIKRNLSSNQINLDILRETDLIQRICSVKTLKRLDLSFNNLSTYPRQLCDLILLELLNLTGNNLSDHEFPPEIEKYQNLIELILDTNILKRIPKCITKLGNLRRLSIRNNKLAELKNLTNLKKLKFLIVDNNSLTQLDESVRPLDQLEVLVLRKNSINHFDINLFKLSFNCLKQIDLSFNKISSISSELFMLPHLELLNLSNNSLNKLPMIPQSFYRTVPIFSVDISFNQLVRFYDYLLVVGKHVDISSNRIKAIQSKMILKLTMAQISSNTLKLNDNPIVEPPFEIFSQGLKQIREYFDEENLTLQINKGFKIIILGDKQSGKTALAYALEDFNTHSNLIEQYNLTSGSETNVESKFFEIHEFTMKSEELSTEDNDRNEYYFTTESLSLKSSSSRRNLNSTQTSSNRTIPKISEPLNSHTNPSTLTTSNSSNDINNKPIYKSAMQCTIYDFNGSLKQFGHLIGNFVDKSALIIICIDATHLAQNTDEASIELNLKKYLDIILFKMAKNISFYILPVLTKLDKLFKVKIEDLKSNVILKSITAKVETWLKSHISSRLEDIRSELKKIEQLSEKSSHELDRLKNLAQIQANITPHLHNCLGISSLKMLGVNELNSTVKEIVCDNQKYFPEVNRKIPTFWIEVEKYVCNDLCEIPTTKYVEEGIEIINNPDNPSLSMLFIDYNYYKVKTIEKYGMSHLIERITKYLHSAGKIIWFSESELLMRNVFLRPNVLFDMLFVLFRTNFSENFLDSHTEALRRKLLKNSVIMDEENLKRLEVDLINKGQLSMDLLKLLWYPILIIESNELIQETFLLFAEYFNIGYPDLSKEKLKILLKKLPSNNSNKVNQHEIDKERKKIHFTNMIIPFYLPVLNNVNLIENVRSNLNSDCLKAVAQCVEAGGKKEMPKLLPKLSHKYVFPWGLPEGVFEKFTSKCIFNSDLYYKTHFKNFAMAQSHDNTIG